MKYKTTVVLSLITVFIIVVCYLASTSGVFNNQRSSAGEHNEVISEVSSRYDAFVKELEGWATNNTAIAAQTALAENRPELIDPGLKDARVSLYSIQGISLSGSSSIRENLAYQRLMGHMDYYTVLENSEVTTYFKIFDKPGAETGHVNFLGIVAISVPIERFTERLGDLDEEDVFILDNNKLAYLLREKRAVPVDEDSDLMELAKKLSLQERGEGIVNSQALGSAYVYTVGERAVVGIKID